MNLTDPQAAGYPSRPPQEPVPHLDQIAVHLNIPPRPYADEAWLVQGESGNWYSALEIITTVARVIDAPGP